MASKVYSPVWKALKRVGKARIKLNIKPLENPDKRLAKVRKAIIKEKYLDHKYKRYNPSVRLDMQFDSESNILTITLVGVIPMGAENISEFNDED